MHQKKDRQIVRGKGYHVLRLAHSSIEIQLHVNEESFTQKHRKVLGSLFGPQKASLLVGYVVF